MNNIILDDTAVGRGNRLKKVRDLVNFSAEELAKKVGCSRQTISYWENATHGGLSKKGAQKIVHVLKDVGLSCDINWLLYGMQSKEEPLAVCYDAQQDFKINEQIESLQEYSSQPILEEMNLFKKLNPDAVTMQIRHSIFPFCMPHDWIGGCFENVSTCLFGKLCIVELKEGLQVRLVEKGDKTDTIKLHALVASDPIAVIEENKPLRKAAPITRIWKCCL